MQGYKHGTEAGGIGQLYLGRGGQVCHCTYEDHLSPTRRIILLCSDTLFSVSTLLDKAVATHEILPATTRPVY